MFDNAVSPFEWGSRIDYDSKNWTPWKPDKWVIHYGGGAVSGANDGRVREENVLQAWEWYHLSKSWLGIAYNYAIGQSGTLYRLRGEQRSGATSGDVEPDGIPENHEARAVVFILGGTQEPSDAALGTFSDMWLEDPMPVIGHRNTTNTSCPGDALYDWITQEGYDNMGLTKGQIETVVALDWAVRSVGSTGGFAKYVIPDIRKGIVTLDELNEAIAEISDTTTVDEFARTLAKKANARLDKIKEAI